MKTVHEVSKISGVSVRTLRHYDAIGLLKPTARTEAGYRLYDDTALERLRDILLFRELEFPLREIREILDSPDFDRSRALEQQITLLTLKKEHLQNLIDLARGIKMTGVNKMDFTAFDTSKIDQYAAEAKAVYGKSAEWREYTEKSKDRTPEDNKKIVEEMMLIFAEFGAMKQLPAESETVQKQVKKLQEFITEHFYTCSDEILSNLGRMYSGNGEFMKNIDSAGGEGTAVFVNEAINICCKK